MRSSRSSLSTSGVPQGFLGDVQDPTVFLLPEEVRLIRVEYTSLSIKKKVRREIKQERKEVSAEGREE